MPPGCRVMETHAVQRADAADGLRPPLIGQTRSTAEGTFSETTRIELAL